MSKLLSGLQQFLIQGGAVPLKKPITPHVVETEVFGTLQITANVGGSSLDDRNKRAPDFVEVIVERPTEAAQRGLIFLGVDLGVRSADGHNHFTELDGCIEPTQLDKLISCLTVVRDRIAELGL